LHHSKSPGILKLNGSVHATSSDQSTGKERVANPNNMQGRPKTERKDAAASVRNPKDKLPDVAPATTSKQKGIVKGNSFTQQDNSERMVAFQKRSCGNDDGGEELMEEEEEEEEGEEELDGEPVSKEEAERLIFGNKDFTQGGDIVGMQGRTETPLLLEVILITW
jgi:hypothetical protein